MVSGAIRWPRDAVKCALCGVGMEEVGICAPRAESVRASMSTAIALVSCFILHI
jgi:hypothetical protein